MIKIKFKGMLKSWQGENIGKKVCMIMSMFKNISAFKFMV